jgi:hypothetical protein
MNTRIKELAEQAGFQYIKDEDIGWAGNHNSSLPKFAELIVRECVSILDSMGDPEVDSCRYVLALHNASHNIRQHFGIKE